MALGCSTLSAPPSGSPLEPLSSVGAIVPDDPDLGARDLAAAALAGPREAALAELERLEALEAQRREAGEPPTGLVPIGRDLTNATLDDPVAYRRASQALLKRDDLDKALESRLRESVADDPLALAKRRLRDARIASFAQVFNALAAPLARSATAGLRSAWGLFRSLVNIALAEHLEEELSFRERQALAHWKRFLEAHPDSPEAARLVDRVEHTQLRWARTRRDRSVRAARRALEDNRVAAALLLSSRALHYAPEDQEATKLRDEAAARLERIRENQRRALEADAPADLATVPDAARALAVALLARDGDVEVEAWALLGADPRGPLADEARFALALATWETGGEHAESEGWAALEELSHRDPARSNMARHAYALVKSPVQNPYDAFREVRRSDRWDQIGWVLFGPLGDGPRDLDLPRPLEWLIDFPSLVQMLTSFPNRLLRFPWLSPWPFGRAPAAFAYRYLERYPDGEHVPELAAWLEDYEKDRGNSIGAYQLALAAGTTDPDDLAALRERAAQQAFEGTRRERRRDLRNVLLRRIAREYQGTRAGQKAGELARRELTEATAQHIRISRGFLEENPEVAGPEGLGLRPELTDGELANGELHPDGVILTGGRTLEFHFVGADGDEDAPPAIRRREVSDERLARIAALLEETAIRNAREDPDDVFGPDPDRDLFFERARLGIADEPDRRPAAESTYAFVGMRERYGLVRGRESILPVELVIQGSLPDFALAVFPRVKTPKPTPDAVFYR